MAHGEKVALHDNIRTAVCLRLDIKTADSLRLPLQNNTLHKRFITMVAYSTTAWLFRNGLLDENRNNLSEKRTKTIQN